MRALAVTLTIIALVVLYFGPAVCDRWDGDGRP